MTNLLTLLRDLQLKVTRGEPALIGGALGEAADEIEKARRTGQFWKDEKLAADAEIERLRSAMFKVIAHTGYHPPGSLDLLSGLIASIKRIAHDALHIERSPVEPTK